MQLSITEQYFPRLTQIIKTEKPMWIIVLFPKYHIYCDFFFFFFYISDRNL